MHGKGAWRERGTRDLPTNAGVSLLINEIGPTTKRPNNWFPGLPRVLGGNNHKEISVEFLPAAKPTGLVEANSSSFFLLL